MIDIQRPCTCHPDDDPPVPCVQKYALSECRLAASQAECAELRKLIEEIRLDPWEPYRIRSKIDAAMGEKP